MRHQLLYFWNFIIALSLFKNKTKSPFSLFVFYSVVVGGGGEGGAMPQMRVKGAVYMISFFTFHISIPRPFNLVPEVLTAGNMLNGNPLFGSY